MSSKNNTESDDNPQHVPNENGDNQDDVLEEGYDNYIYRDFAHVTCSDPWSSKNHPAPHKLPAKLGAILTDPGEITLPLPLESSSFGGTYLLHPFFC